MWISIFIQRLNHKHFDKDDDICHCKKFHIIITHKLVKNINKLYLLAQKDQKMCKNSDIEREIK